MSIPLPNLPHWAFADKHDLVPSEVRTDIKRYGESYAAAVSAAKDAEIAQLRQYLDTAQRRASALGDEVAGLREAQIDYTVLHGFADKHRISYNELCVAVRAALAARKGELL